MKCLPSKHQTNSNTPSTPSLPGVTEYGRQQYFYQGLDGGYLCSLILRQPTACSTLSLCCGWEGRQVKITGTEGLKILGKRGQLKNRVTKIGSCQWSMLSNQIIIVVAHFFGSRDIHKGLAIWPFGSKPGWNLLPHAGPRPVGRCWWSPGAACKPKWGLEIRWNFI